MEPQILSGGEKAQGVVGKARCFSPLIGEGGEVTVAIIGQRHLCAQRRGALGPSVCTVVGVCP